MNGVASRLRPPSATPPVVAPAACTIRLLLVDDQELARAGLRKLLRRRDGFEIVGECTAGSDVLQAVRAQHPDVVIMEICMRGVDGVATTRALSKLPGPPPVLVLTTFDHDDVVIASLAAGAAGFVRKEAPVEDLMRAVREVAAGSAWLDPAITRNVLIAYRKQAPRRENAELVATLTEREHEVLRLLAEGSNNSEIAQRLYISAATVKSHSGRIFSKLGVRGRGEAIAFAYIHCIV
jgi:DNA-binding NarL/FixJ family response regulator